MPKLGLIGHPLGHSFSPAWFRKKFETLSLSDWSYHLFDITDSASLLDIIKTEKELLAVNVTIPHKTEIIKHCQVVSEEVKAIGAANLIVIDQNEEPPVLMAFNTDYKGFSDSLRNTGRNYQQALILGSGGSSKAVAYALEQSGILYERAGNSQETKYKDCHLGKYDLIINCTPAGMKNDKGFPDMLPLRYDTASTDALFFDMVYNPENTAMMNIFREKGLSVVNGLEMLYLQAENAWNIIGEFT